MKFRMKPEVIEAFQWTGGPEQTENPEWIVTAMIMKQASIQKDPLQLVLWTLEGVHQVNPGDWIIKGMGELRPMKNETFLQTYEKVLD